MLGCEAVSMQVVAGQREGLDCLVGTVVAEKYRVDGLLGQGGMGAVFQATNLAIGKRVALKFLTRDAARDVGAAERFQREALAAGLAESAHIVQIFDSGISSEGLPFLVMELLSGEDLRACLRRERRLPAARAVHIVAQVLRALSRAHAAGIVHRDLKPDNVFLCARDDDTVFVKLVDFGISKLAASSTLDTLTRRGTVLGTAHYMSPEQAQAFEDIDGRTDLFSVGAILYECLAGRPPQTGTTYEAVLIALCTKDAEDIRVHASEVSAALRDVIHKALARERAERFTTAAEFLTALQAASPDAFSLQLGATSVSRTPGVGAGSASPRRSRWASGWSTAAIAVLAGFGLTAFWMSRGSSGTSAPLVAAPFAATPLPQAAQGTASPSPAPQAAQGTTPAVQVAASTGTQSTAPPAASSSARGVAEPASAAMVTAGNKARRRPEKSADKAPRTSGVASGLELSTREP